MQRVTNGAVFCMLTRWKLQPKIDGGCYQVEKLLNKIEIEVEIERSCMSIGSRSFDMERSMEERRAAVGVNCLNDGKRNRRSEARSCARVFSAADASQVVGALFKSRPETTSPKIVVSSK